MGTAQRAQATERRLKFASVRRRENQVSPEPAPKRPEPLDLAAIGEAFAAAYVAIARRVLFGLEALQDQRAQRRKIALRRASAPDGNSP